MHIPVYAHGTIRAAVPALPTVRQLESLDCCVCGAPFGRDLGAVPLGPDPGSGPSGCRPCLRRLVTRAREARDAALAQDADRIRQDAEAWESARAHHIARLEAVRRAAEEVAELAGNEEIPPLRLAWLMISLESACAWIPDAPESPPSVDQEDRLLSSAELQLGSAMITVREATADRLAYHLINEAQPDEPEMCGEMECPEECTGRHDTSHIDCGPDAVFEELQEHGITLDAPGPGPLSPRLAALFAPPPQKESPLLPGLEERAGPALAALGVDTDDPEALLSAAAAGLVADVLASGPLDAIREAPGGPGAGDVLAQSVDLHRRARKALVAARDGGPARLAAFTAVATDLDLPWAGGSRFTLRSASGPVSEFVRNVEREVWVTEELVRRQGWRDALLHRALSASSMAAHRFGMPGWPAAVSASMERLASLDRQAAPKELADLHAVETALLQGPDRLGVEALGWLDRHAPLG
ncbi:MULTISPECIES: hypothetical protein [Streptomyces]|uniref:Uncharacterized protein n=1 Tax=Streptomyces viridochromogenes TaxID=1938 RepID=A0A0L8J4B1_STRVR|nr:MULTISPECIES: hypothetical protein [Streptomyces]KOG08496.1 hypothetical protein ADK34_38750 [Streptomyces viridochromogenes]